MLTETLGNAAREASRESRDLNPKAVYEAIAGISFTLQAILDHIIEKEDVTL